MRNPREVAEGFKACFLRSTKKGGGVELSGQFTAREIATVLGITPRSALRLLSDVPSDGLKRVSGVFSRAWSIGKMPGEMAARLQSAAENAGFKGISEMLDFEAVRPSLQELSEGATAKAQKLRDALREPLAQQHTLSRSALCELGLRRYREELGKVISKKQWERIFDRIARAGGDFENLSLYFDRRCVGNKPATATISANDLEELQIYVDAWGDGKNPTPLEKATFLDAAFRLFRPFEAVGAGFHARKSLISYIIQKAPAIASSKNSARMLFDRWFARWKSEGSTPSAILDQRSLKSGYFRRPEFKQDWDKIRAWALNHRANESLAYRKLRMAGELSADFIAYYDYNIRKNKSYVPHAGRALITPQVNATMPLVRGEREFQLKVGVHHRDWTAVQPGDWFSGDDVTLNHYFYNIDENGELYIGRGECLLLADLRTGYPLGFILIAGKYNGRFLRKIISRVHDDHGLPHRGFYFEKGIWKSRLIAGQKIAGASPMVETESGLRDHGLEMELINAQTARAKPIEQFFNALQFEMTDEPGYVGRNERLENMERVQKQIALVRAGHAHPSKFFLNMEEWSGRISAILDRLKNEPQNGERLPGISASEAWTHALMARPLRKLPDDARYILSSHRRRVTVQPEGIVLKVGMQRFVYQSEKTGQLIGQKVLAYFNIETPEILAVSDENRENFFTVKENRTPAIGASREQLANANAQIRAHQSGPRSIYGAMKKDIASTVVHSGRYSAQVKELGRFINTAEAQHKAEAEKEEARRRVEDQLLNDEYERLRAELLREEEASMREAGL